jgi:hypothetical protein
MKKLIVVCLVMASIVRVHTGKATEASEEKVFLDGIPGTIVVDTQQGELRIRKAEYGLDGNTYMMDGRLYPIDWGEVRENARKFDVKRRLSLKSALLYFDDKAVALPQEVKMREVWAAVLWNGWVLCLGRTSNTDKEANDTPPFFASELVAFRPLDRKATVRYLTFSPPGKTTIKILQAQPPKK